MQIRLDQIVDEPFEWSEERPVEAGSLEADQPVELGTVTWEGRVAPLESGHLLTARLQYEQVLECPRCLGPVRQPVDAEIEYLVVPRDGEPMAGEVELGEEDLGILYVEGEVLDTEPLLLEQIQLNLPMRQLCRDDCSGLCPACGANLNDETCDCEKKPSDPRWSGLAALRERMESS